MDESAKVMKLVERAAAFGFRETSSGAKLFGHVPRIAPEAWLHATYPPLSEEELSALEGRLGRPIPTDYREFLRSVSNGISLYSNRLNIYGVRTSYDRSGDFAWQPFALETLNTVERPTNSKSSYLYLGSYSEDGSKLVLDTDSAHLLRVPNRKAGPIMNSWEGFWSMLSTEANRLATFFDERGNRIDATVSTLPP